MPQEVPGARSRLERNAARIAREGGSSEEDAGSRLCIPHYSNVAPRVTRQVMLWEVLALEQEASVGVGSRSHDPRAVSRVQIRGYLG